MVDAMKTAETGVTEIQNCLARHNRHIQIDASVISPKQLPDFISVNSNKLLVAMHMNLDFLTASFSQ